MWDPNETTRNINAWPPEELARYAGLYVGWALDGKSILAYGATWDEMFDMAERLGLEGGSFIADYLDEGYARDGIPSLLSQRGDAP
jgi:hypothetical protein